MEAKKIEVKILLSSIIIIFLVETAVRAVIPAGLPFPVAVVGVVRLVEMTLILLMIYHWSGGLSSIGLAKDQILPGLAKGLVWSAGFGLTAAICMAVIYAVGVNPLKLLQPPMPGKTGELIVYFIVGGAAAPVAEEIFFRGIVYGFLRRWGVLPALLISTLFFVAAHSKGTAVPLTQSAGGIVFALAYELEGRLMVPITIHALGNMAIFSLTLLG